MSRGKGLLKNTIMIFIGKASTQLLTFILLPFYTSYLDKTEYGTVDLIFTYVSLLIPIVTLELSNALFRFLIDKRENKNESSDIVTFSILTISIFLIIFSIIGYLLGCFFYFEHTLVFIVMVITNSYSYYFLQLSRGMGNYKLYSITSVLIGITTIVLNIVFIVILKFGIAGIFLSTIISNLIASIFVFLTCKVYKYINFDRIDFKTGKDLLSYSIPLIPNSIIWWIINVSDRTIISIFLGISYNGIYSIAIKFSTIITSIFTIFNLSWQESVSVNINDEEGQQFISETFNKLIKLIGAMCIGLISIMWIIFPILINDKFSEAFLYVPILIVASFFSVFVGLLGAIYIGLKKTKEITKTTFMSGLINIIVNLLFIKYIGVYAAAISTLLAFFTMSIYRYFSISKDVNLHINGRNIISISIFFIIILIIYYINITWLNIIGIIISLIFIFVFSNDEIIQIVKIIKNKINNS